MKTSLKPLSTIFLAFVLICPAFGFKGGPGTKSSPRAISLDLAIPVVSNTIFVKNGEYISIGIKNMLPSGQYSIAQDLQPNIPPVLTSPPVHALAAPPAAACAALEAQLAAAASEANFGLLMDKAKSIPCNDLYNNYSAVSTKDLGTFTLNNQTLTVTITNVVSKTVWTFAFKTPEQGKWLTTYGFTFIPLAWGKSHKYFAQQSQDSTMPGKYNIVESRNESHWMFAPTVMFHYIAYSEGAVSISPTGGLGINITNTADNGISPLVFFGVSFLYRANLGLNFGIAGHQVDNLKGNYSTSVPIATNLDSTDLNQKVIVLNPFVSLTLRFGGSHPYASATTTTGTN
ncbi:hypothetical protein KXD93_16795 [Mucilaginibacter sp. BJC16-A38]|uniref:hypothetical protein n=1 Tax=Mucilaginibacter phenanthrenivorans TaxID=1234842 RepID=UPI00215878F1|nr:hypothetical protein [Mucilaginibacter phenanthrenivorans]MCR8559318.1 hypothetical protein [Mucilaginibacter phenanthrenivorans]